jgi:hypothetical protein
VFPLREPRPHNAALMETDCETAFERCANAESAALCNWLVSAEEVAAGESLCRSCHLNRTIPNLSTADNPEYWGTIELAKRLLVSGLLDLGLPVRSKVAEDPDRGMAFDLMEDPRRSSGPVLTGHEDGIITLNIAEANDSTREDVRRNIGEPYRTLLAARVEIPIFGRSKIYPLSGRHADEKGFIWQDRG